MYFWDLTKLSTSKSDSHKNRPQTLKLKKSVSHKNQPQTQEVPFSSKFFYRPLPRNSYEYDSFKTSRPRSKSRLVVDSSAQGTSRRSIEVAFPNSSHIKRQKRSFLRFIKFCWVAKHTNIIMKPTNSPTQGQPNPRKSRLKVAIGPLFPTANNFSWVGAGFI